MIRVDRIAGLPTAELRRPAVRRGACRPHALDGDGDGRGGHHPRHVRQGPGLAGSRGVADPRSATRDPGRNQRPAIRDPERPGPARVRRQ